MASQDSVDDPRDFSCYITINNLSDEDFVLGDSGINGQYGVWSEGQPVNTIKAHTSPTVVLRNANVYGGSEGWVEYEVPAGDKTETFRLEFADPESPWAKNYLRAKSTDPGVLSVSVKPYKESGHPFSGTVNVKVTGPKVAPNRAQELISGAGATQPPIVKSAESDNSSFQANYEIGFEGPTRSLVNKFPVHESIAVAAFIQSKKPFPKGTTYHNLNDKQWEYFRGLVWNDDPACYLFSDYPQENHHFSTGLLWYEDFKFGDPGCMIQRSHHGDLQFLHAMGVVGEEPKETQRKILKWLEVMYKLACGNQGLSKQDQLKQHLGEWFNDKTKPSDHRTLLDLLVASTPSYYQTDIQQRALGLCLHIVSDSYAIGHTQRRLKNPDAYQGRDRKGYLTFKPGTYGDWGAVMMFHCYSGQNSGRHSYYDGLRGAPPPVPENLNSFNAITGARNAIEACKKLIGYFADGTKWEDGVRTFLETEVFPIDKDARPSNSQVDEAEPVSVLVPQIAGATSHLEYQAGLQRKLASLETGTSDTHGLTTMGRRPMWRYILFPVSLFVVAILFTFVGIQVRGLMH